MPYARRQPRRRHALWLVCAVAAGFGGASAAAAPDPGSTAPSSGQRAERPNLDELLDRFPIGTQPVRTTPVEEREPPAATKPKPAPQRPAGEATNVSKPTEASSSGDTLLVVLVAGTSALLLLVTLGAWAVRVQRGKRLSTFSVSSSSVSQPTLALFQQTLALARKGRSTQVAEVSQNRSSSLFGARQQSRAEQKPGKAGESDYTGVGERVIAILEAAEAAGAQIRADAATAAAEIRNAAELEASVQLQKAGEEAARIQSEAEARVEALSAEWRREAVERAREEVAEAESHARLTREAGEEAARQIELAARERAEVVRAQVQPLEENMRRALGAFRGISAQLEELLEAEEEPEDSLVEALSGPARQESRN
jgi:hypothetical protein